MFFNPFGFYMKMKRQRRSLRSWNSRSISVKINALPVLLNR